MLNLTTGLATTSSKTDTLVGLENATGGSAADLLIGDAAVNVLRGGGGNDILVGSGGDDALLGDAGSDRLGGLAGNDRLNGGAGADTADYSSFFSANLRVGVIVDLVRGQAAGDGTDSLDAIENVLGSSFNDRLIGNGGANILTGAAGNDLLDGKAGKDKLNGGGGNDVFRARDGRRQLERECRPRLGATRRKLDRAASIERRLRQRTR